MTKKTLRDAMGAEIINETSTSYLVQYDDDTVESVAKNSLHGTLCKVSAIDVEKNIHAHGRAIDIDGYDGDGIDITLEINMSSLSGTISIGGRADCVVLTGSALGSALIPIEEEAQRAQAKETTAPDDTQSLSKRIDQSDTQGSTFDQSNVMLSNDIATELYSVYENILYTRVRENVVNKFASSYSGVEITDNGWIIEDTYLVTYDAENYIIDDIEVYNVSSGDVVETDSVQQAVGLSFDVEPYTVFTINGEDHTISSKEQTFLATVEFLNSPSNYLDIDSFEKEVYSAIRHAKGDPIQRSQIEEITSTVTVNHFIDPKSGLIHRHDIDKHVLRSTFSINQWVIDNLNYSSFDHAGLAELAYREDEFRSAAKSVFFDGTPNDDDDRWSYISRLEKNAPCPPEVYRTLKSLHGSR